MGVAAIGILLCHAGGNGVQLPYALGYVFGFGNFGVDLFLLLSGFGLYNSLHRSLQTDGIGGWYRRRFTRLLVPYLILSIPYWAYICKIEGVGIKHFLYYISTLVYWFEHRGAWFVALIVPLYLISPIIYRICVGKKGIIKLLFLTFIVGIIAIIPNNSYIWGNMAFALERTPCFFLGFITGKLAEKGVEIKYSNVILLCLCMFVCNKLFRVINVNIFGLLACPILWIVTIIAPMFFKCNILSKVLGFMGAISLESYLTNIYLGDICRKLNYDNKLFVYTLIIIIGIALSYVVNIFSNKIIRPTITTRTTISNKYE